MVDEIIVLDITSETNTVNITVSESENTPIDLGITTYTNEVGVNFLQSKGDKGDKGDKGEDGITQDISGLVPKTTTVNGHALTDNVIVTATDLNLGNVDNTSDANKPVSTAQQTALNLKADSAALSSYVPTSRTVNSKALSSNITLTTADIADSADKRYCTDAQKTVIGNTSGTNTGDETASTIKTKLGVTTLSGSNTGDQDLSGYATISALTTGLAGKSDTTHNHSGTYEPLKGADDNYVTDAEKTALHSHSNKTVLDNITASYTTAEQTKLSGIEANANNYSLPTASTSTMGGVKVDGSTITITDGVISSSGGGTTYTGTDGIVVNNTTDTITLDIISSETTIYVATTGNDTTGDGTSGNPYASIAKALSTLKNKVLKALVTIQVANGTYTISNAIIVNHPNYNYINIVGNVNTPSDCILNISSSTGIIVAGIDIFFYFQIFAISGFKFVNTGEPSTCISTVVSMASFGNEFYGFSTGIDCSFSTSTIISYCTFAECEDGVFAGDTYCSVQNCTFSGIVSEYANSGITCLGGIIMEANCTFEYVTTAIYAGAGANIMSLGGNTFTNCTTEYSPALNTVGNSNSYITG